MFTIRAQIGINVLDHDSSRFSLRNNCAKIVRWECFSFFLFPSIFYANTNERLLSSRSSCLQNASCKPLEPVVEITVSSMSSSRAWAEVRFCELVASPSTPATASDNNRIESNRNADDLRLPCFVFLHTCADHFRLAQMDGCSIHIQIKIERSAICHNFTRPKQFVIGMFVEFMQNITFMVWIFIAATVLLFILVQIKSQLSR